MNPQQKNQMKQSRETRDQQYESQKVLHPIELQNTYNKENLEAQHNHNLEIFGKQAELAREINDKQTKMMGSSNRLIAIATITATLPRAIVGAVVQAILPEMIRKTPKITTQQSTQSDIKLSTSAPHSESKAGKVPSLPSSK